MRWYDRSELNADGPASLLGVLELDRPRLELHMLGATIALPFDDEGRVRERLPPKA